MGSSLRLLVVVRRRARRGVDVSADDDVVVVEETSSGALSLSLLVDDFDDFVDLVVPELQRRELYRREYAGMTLRDHLRQVEG